MKTASFNLFLKRENHLKYKIVYFIPDPDFSSGAPRSCSLSSKSGDLTSIATLSFFSLCIFIGANSSVNFPSKCTINFLDLSWQILRNSLLALSATTFSTFSLDLYPVVLESLKSSIFPPDAEITAAIIST